MEKLLKLYKEKKSEIKKRLNEFKDIYKNGTDEDIFVELVFCIFTPQSNAQNCWATVLELKEKDLILNGKEEDLIPLMNRVRFRNKKSKFLIMAREQFTKDGKIQIKDFIDSFKDKKELRNWIEKNIKGIGFKEAGHFLRNIGFGQKLAILDRHIMRYLNEYGAIEELPKTLTKKFYFEIEDKMEIWSKKIKIPMDELDLLLFFKGNGEIFK